MSEYDRSEQEQHLRALARSRIERLSRTATALHDRADEAYTRGAEQDLEEVADELDRLLSEREQARGRAQPVAPKSAPEIQPLPKTSSVMPKGRESLDQVLGALERLDAKVAELTRQEPASFAPEDPDEEIESEDASGYDYYEDEDDLQDVRWQDEPVAPPQGEPRRGLRDRLVELGAGPDRRGDSREDDLSSGAYHDLGRRIDALRKPQEETMQAVREGLGSLRDAISGYAAGNRERTSRHNTELRHLSEMVERLRADRSDDTALRDMRKEVAEVKALIGRSNVDGALKTLEHGYAHILQRLDELNRGAVDPRVLKGITTRLNEIEDAFAALPRGDQMELLEERVGDISQRMEQVVSAHRNVDIAPLKAELSELREVVSRIDFTEVVESIDDRMRFVASRLDELEHLAREQRGLDTRLSAMEDRLPDAQMLDRLQGRLEDIVGMLSEEKGQLEDPRIDEIAGRLERMERSIPESGGSEALATLESKLEAIAGKIDSIEKKASRPVPVLDASANKPGLSDDNLRLLGDLQTRIGQLSDQLARPAETVTSADLDLLRREIGEMRSALVAPPQTEALERRITELAETLSSGREAIDDSRLDQLGAKVSELLEQLESTSDREDETSRIAAALARIEGNLKANRDDVVVIAKEAAREVASGMPKGTSTEYDAAIAGLQGDLRNLLAAAQGSEERTRNTFEGVQSVLSTLTDRLEQLEKVNRSSGRAKAGGKPAFLKREPSTRGGQTAVASDRPAERTRDRKADFIAAARRAAQAATEEAAALDRQASRKVVDPRAASSDTMRFDESPQDDAASNGRGENRAGWLRRTLNRNPDAGADAQQPEETDRYDDLAKRGRPGLFGSAPSAPREETKSGGGRRRALMFAAAAVVLALGTLQIVRLVTPSSQELAETKSPLVTEQGSAAQNELAALSPSTSYGDDAASDIAQPDDNTVQIAPEPLKDQPSEQARADVGAPQSMPAEGSLVGESDSELAFGAPSVPQIIGEAEPVPANGFSGATQESSPANLNTPLPPEKLGSVALRTAAARGDAAASFIIGVKYTEGDGVPADLSEAAKWYQKAAEKGLAPAQYRLASLYEKGRGVDQDRVKARDWYTKAAEAGNAKAMHNLAVLHAEGVDGDPDFAKAAKWFEMAANYGIKDSLFNLGILYARGLGVKKDLQASYKWFAIAADQGDQDAAQKRDEIANLLDQEGLANARLSVENFKMKSPSPEANKVMPEPSWAAGTGYKTDASTVLDNVADYASIVMEVQQQLNRLGYKVGTADGAMGPRTRSAIRAFQRKAGAPETGEADADLLKQLERYEA